MKREDYIEDFLRHGCDLIPHNDAEYEKKLLEAANDYADFMMNPQIVGDSNKVLDDDLNF